MDIAELLIQQPQVPHSPTLATCQETQLIPEDELMSVWSTKLYESGFRLKTMTESSKLTDAIIEPLAVSALDKYVTRTFLHMKIIGRHTNGSFRCHIGMGKASRPIRSTELFHRMRLLAVFFRPEKAKNHLVSSEFILFPTWILHLFRYTKHRAVPGRTDVRFLENATLAKEDHIYRLNHVISSLFRFNIHELNDQKLRDTVALANYLFDVAGLNHQQLPRPIPPGEHASSDQPDLYLALLTLLHMPRPSKCITICSNCNTKPASRRKLCVACYRYQLKHGAPRPLRLIVANRPGPRLQGGDDGGCSAQETQPGGGGATGGLFQRPKKQCANCGVQETHQWYRNLCGPGHWCETCKSYYLRHTKVRPRELFVKAAKRKVNVRAILSDSSWTFEQPTASAPARSPMPHQKLMDQYPSPTEWSPSPSLALPHTQHDKALSSSSSSIPVMSHTTGENGLREYPTEKSDTLTWGSGHSSPVTPQLTRLGHLDHGVSIYSPDSETLSSWMPTLSPCYKQPMI